MKMNQFHKAFPLLVVALLTAWAIGVRDTIDWQHEMRDPLNLWRDANFAILVALILLRGRRLPPLKALRDSLIVIWGAELTMLTFVVSAMFAEALLPSYPGPSYVWFLGVLLYAFLGFWYLAFAVLGGEGDNFLQSQITVKAHQLALAAGLGSGLVFGLWTK